MYTFGWFSTGRDEAARQLLTETWNAIQEGMIPATLGFVFCDRELGDGLESDRFIQLVTNLGIPIYSISSRRFDSALRRENQESWLGGG